jgi:hypothetical protein
VGRAKHLVVEENSAVKRNSKVRAKVACGIELAVITGYEYLLVFLFTNLESSHLAVLHLCPKWNAHLFEAFLRKLICVTEIILLH